MTTQRVACRCGFLTLPGPFCEACGSPLKQRRAAAEAPAFRPARTPPPAPLPTIPVSKGGRRPEPETPPIPDGILCTWCGAVSPPGPGCETCGSPIDTGNLVREEDVRFDQDSPARPPGAERGKLRLITPPPPEEGSDPEERRDVGT